MENNKKNKKRQQKEIKKGLLEGTKTSIHWKKKSTVCFVIHQTKLFDTKNTNKCMLASCTYNMQYFYGGHPAVMMSVQINTKTI
jgi:hypothetical protein